MKSLRTRPLSRHAEIPRGQATTPNLGPCTVPTGNGGAPLDPDRALVDTGTRPTSLIGPDERRKVVKRPKEGPQLGTSAEPGASPNIPYTGRVGQSTQVITAADLNNSEGAGGCFITRFRDESRVETLGVVCSALDFPGEVKELGVLIAAQEKPVDVPVGSVTAIAQIPDALPVAAEAVEFLEGEYGERLRPCKWDTEEQHFICTNTDPATLDQLRRKGISGIVEPGTNRDYSVLGDSDESTGATREVLPPGSQTMPLSADPKRSLDPFPLKRRNRKPRIEVTPRPTVAELAARGLRRR